MYRVNLSYELTDHQKDIQQTIHDYVNAKILEEDRSAAIQVIYKLLSQNKCLFCSTPTNGSIEILQYKVPACPECERIYATYMHALICGPKSEADNV